MKKINTKQLTSDISNIIEEIEGQIATHYIERGKHIDRTDYIQVGDVISVIGRMRRKIEKSIKDNSSNITEDVK